LQAREILTVGALLVLGGGVHVQVASACTPVGPRRFPIGSLRTGSAPRILKASASMTRGDPTSRGPCASLSSLAIGLELDSQERIGLLIEPLGGTDPMDAGSEGYGARPLEVDATEHVTLPFFTDGHAMNFGLRLVPVSLAGVRGAPFDLWVQEPALPGMAQFLFRNGWLIRWAAMGLLVTLVASVLVVSPLAYRPIKLTLRPQGLASDHVVRLGRVALVTTSVGQPSVEIAVVSLVR